MSDVHCPNCNEAHDGSTDANGWATCKECVHLWNLRAQIEKSKTGAATVGKAGVDKKENPSSAANQGTDSKEALSESLPSPELREMANDAPALGQGEQPSVKKSLSGYFPDENVPKKTAALTKKKEHFSESALGRIQSEAVEVDSGSLPANSTMLSVEEEDRQKQAQQKADEESKEIHSDFPDMKTRFTDNSENEGDINCPVCGASFQFGKAGGEATCPHCDTSFNVNTGRYQVGSGKNIEPISDIIETYAGQIIGGCKIGQKLGEGGMGSVYHAKQLSLDRDVALKILPPDLTSQANFMKRFQQEARSLARINHSNIIGIYEFGEDKDTKLHYMMMEYVDGEDLAELLRRRHHLTEIETLDILKQSAVGLEQAALKGIIHRDIKPDNLMMTEGGLCKVSDFGLAKNVASDSTMTNASIRVGTPAFMSPEQCDGLRLDFRSDVYSLGVTAFVMLTGHLPYNGESPFAIMIKHKVDPIPSVRDSLPHISEAVDQFVQRMMQKEPEQRFSSWRVLREELDSVIEKITGKTQEFTKAADPIMPTADLPTERTNLNADADPEEDLSGMLASLGELERPDAGHPPLRSQSKEFSMGGDTGLDESGALPTVDDPLGFSESTTQPSPVIPDSVPAAPDLSLVEPGTPIDLSLGDVAPAIPNSPPPVAPGSGAFASPPLPPGSGSYQSPVNTGSAPGSGAYVPPTQGGQTLGAQADSSNRISGDLQAVTDSTNATTRSSSSSPLSASTESAVKGSKSSESGRRGKNTSAVRDRMKEAKTEQQNRVTQIRSRAQQLFASGKYKKAIVSWQQASQVTTDVRTREECFERIQLARMMMKQKLKRRAIISAVLLVPILLAATFFCTPIAHNYYVSYQLNEIDKLPNEEMRRPRYKKLLTFGKPFAWYSAVFFGQTYDVKTSELFDAYVKGLVGTGTMPQGQHKNASEIEAVDLSSLIALSKNSEVSWLHVASQADAMTKKVSLPADRKTVNSIKKEARQHLDVLERDIELIEEKIRQGKFVEAEALGKDLTEREPRGGAKLVNLPVQVPLVIVDDSGRVVREPTVIVNGIRVRDPSVAYSLGNAPISIEVRHADYQAFTGEIEAGRSDALNIEMQVANLWVHKTPIAGAAWVDVQSWGPKRILINTPEALLAINAEIGEDISVFKRTHVNIAPGIGRAEWTNSAQVVRDNVLIGSGDGLLLNLGIGENRAFRLNQALFRGNDAVLSSIEFDLMFRSGRSRALLIRQGGSSLSLAGLIDGKEEWRSTGLKGSIDPVIFFRDDHIFVVDDQRFREFEEDGTKRDSIQLPRLRSGAIVWADDATLAFPHESGIDLLHFSGDTYRVKAAVTSEYKLIGGLAQGGAYTLAAFEDGHVRAYTCVAGKLSEAWKYKIKDERKPASMPSVSAGLVCIADEKGSIYCIRARDGKLLRTIVIASPALHPPIIVGDKIICIDQRGLLSAFKAPSVD